MVDSTQNNQPQNDDQYGMIEYPGYTKISDEYRIKTPMARCKKHGDFEYPIKLEITGKTYLICYQCLAEKIVEMGLVVESIDPVSVKTDEK